MSEITSRLSTALADRYRIERHLGEGGMATVYLAAEAAAPRHPTGPLEALEWPRFRYTTERWNRRIASNRTVNAIPRSAKYCGQSSTNPVPRRNTPRTISRKCLTGLASVSH